MAQPKNFWRFSFDSQESVERMIAGGLLLTPTTGVKSEKYDPEAVVAEKIKAGDGLLLGRQDLATGKALIFAIGIAQDSRPMSKVSWKRVKKELHPNPQGGSEPWQSRCFRFSTEPAKAYRLAALFSEHFPEL